MDLRRIALLTFPVLLTACQAESPTVAGVKVAFLQDLSAPDGLEHVLPALQGAELAFTVARVSGESERAIELVPFDLADDPAALDEIAADPAFVAAIVAPGVRDEAPVGATGLPTISLSGLGATPSGSNPWLRLVAPIDDVADALANGSSTSRTCVMSEDPAPDDLGDLVAERLDGVVATIDPAAAADEVGSALCGAVAWVGGPDGGAEAVRALAGSGVAFRGGDRLLGPDFLDHAGPAAEGSMSVCACADISTSLEPAARRFIQDYQSEYGSAPGAYAVEGWDAASLILRALEEGGATRDAVGTWLGTMTAAGGLERSYRFDAEGELVDPQTYVLTYLADGGRWTAMR